MLHLNFLNDDLLKYNVKERALLVKSDILTLRSAYIDHDGLVRKLTSLAMRCEVEIEIYDELIAEREKWATLLHSVDHSYAERRIAEIDARLESMEVDASMTISDIERAFNLEGVEYPYSTIQEGVVNG